MQGSERLYIVHDIECSGNRVGIHSVLSWGACVVTPDFRSTDNLIENGLTFYTELRPQFDQFETDAMKVGSAGLHCLRDQKDLKYDVSSIEFQPNAVIELLREHGEELESALERFRIWLESLKKDDQEIIHVVDTVFFDSVFLQYLFSLVDMQSPFGWKGMDLASLYLGYSGNMGGNLRELGIADDREVAHCALDDAIFLSKIARELIFNRIRGKESI